MEKSNTVNVSLPWAIFIKLTNKHYTQTLFYHQLINVKSPLEFTAFLMNYKSSSSS